MKWSTDDLRDLMSAGYTLQQPPESESVCEREREARCERERERDLPTNLAPSSIHFVAIDDRSLDCPFQQLHVHACFHVYIRCVYILCH